MEAFEMETIGRSWEEIVAAVIDLDGTMVDTADDFTVALNGMLAELNTTPIERTEVALYVGKGSEHLVHSTLVARLGAAEANRIVEHAIALYQAQYEKVNGQYTRLYPNVEAGLAALQASGLQLACVTNKPHHFATALLRQYGLIDYFTVVYGGDSWPKKKPDPLPMLKACEAMGVTPSVTVAIGDSENDALAARAAGLGALTVPYGYNHGKPVQTIKSDGIVDSLLDAAHFLQSYR